ncbi:hypothetical protein ACFLQN_04135 [Candidatus Aenigmatarchaeota archaeon]
MKGITPVIAIILLLLITISMVGFAFIYFTRVTELAGTQLEDSIQNTIDIQSQRVILDNAYETAITVRNTGTASVETTSISVYVDNVFTICDWGVVTDIGPSAVGSCDIVDSCEDLVVRVTSPGGSDSMICGGPNP